MQIWKSPYSSSFINWFLPVYSEVVWVLYFDVSGNLIVATVLFPFYIRWSFSISDDPFLYLREDKKSERLLGFLRDMEFNGKKWKEGSQLTFTC